MPSITGIELGPESCVLVRARPRTGAIEVASLHQIERAAWPAHDTALTATLRDLRKSKRFPRRARVVAWHLAEPAPPGDPVVRALVKPIAAAGFRVEAVVSPPEALAEIARTRPRPPGSAAVWLTLNVHGAAIAIVLGGRLLFGRTFDWTYTAHAIGPRAELLQRYSLVAHLAPEIRRGIAQVRAAHGAMVDAVVTCGDLPDLRSLTMPLIEELDLEVETLDSTDGLVSTGRARSDRFVESAPAVRLAAAAATMTIQRGARRPAIRPAVAVAAGVAIVAAVGWLGYRVWSTLPAAPSTTAAGVIPTQPTGTRPAPSPPRGTAPSPVPSPPARTTSPAVTGPAPAVVTPATRGAATRPSSPPVLETTPSGTRAIEPRATTETRSAGTKPTDAKPREVEPTDVKPTDTRPTMTEPAATRPVETKQTDARPTKPVETAPAPPKPAPKSTNVSEAPAPVARPAPLAVQPDPATVDSPRARTDNSRRTPVPLKAALPSVQSILVSTDRRVAIVDGQIVTIGDRVGPRTVHQIEREAVVLEEPSGFQVRVPIRRTQGG